VLRALITWFGRAENFMGDEENFIQAIRAAPGDYALRLVYADWLEERGDPRAEFLRALVALARLGHNNPRRALLTRRLRELRSVADAAWLAVVECPPIENCGMRFSLECPRQWELLTPTESPTVRFCASCQKRVYYCLSMDQATYHAWRGECVAVESSLVRRVGDLPAQRGDPSLLHQLSVAGTPTGTCTVGMVDAETPSTESSEEVAEGGRRFRRGEKGRRRQQKTRDHDQD
jgi:uncharacterized protein (TIGR02996 family)